VCTSTIPKTTFTRSTTLYQWHTAKCIQVVFLLLVIGLFHICIIKVPSIGGRITDSAYDKFPFPSDDKEFIKSSRPNEIDKVVPSDLFGKIALFPTRYWCPKLVPDKKLAVKTSENETCIELPAFYFILASFRFHTRHLVGRDLCLIFIWTFKIQVTWWYSCKQPAGWRKMHYFFIRYKTSRLYWEFLWIRHTNDMNKSHQWHHN
jgi:hypothetical protein